MRLYERLCGTFLIYAAVFDDLRAFGIICVRFTGYAAIGEDMRYGAHLAQQDKKQAYSKGHAPVNPR